MKNFYILLPSDCMCLSTLTSDATIARFVKKIITNIGKKSTKKIPGISLSSYQRCYPAPAHSLQQIFCSSICYESRMDHQILHRNDSQKLYEYIETIQMKFGVIDPKYCDTASQLVAFRFAVEHPFTFADLTQSIDCDEFEVRNFSPLLFFFVKASKGSLRWQGADSSGFRGLCFFLITTGARTNPLLSRMHLFLEFLDCFEMCIRFR